MPPVPPCPCNRFLTEFNSDREPILDLDSANHQYRILLAPKVSPSNYSNALSALFVPETWLAGFCQKKRRRYTDQDDIYSVCSTDNGVGYYAMGGMLQQTQRLHNGELDIPSGIVLFLNPRIFLAARNCSDVIKHQMYFIWSCLKQKQRYQNSVIFLCPTIYAERLFRWFIYALYFSTIARQRLYDGWVGYICICIFNVFLCLYLYL